MMVFHNEAMHQCIVAKKCHNCGIEVLHTSVRGNLIMVFQQIPVYCTTCYDETAQAQREEDSSGT